MKTTEKVEMFEERKALLGLEASGYRDYAKTLLLLTAGTFALSFFILDRMSSPDYMLFIVYTWTFLLIAILMQLGVLSMYPKAIREEIAALHEDRKERKGNLFYTMMNRMGLLSTVSLGMGIFFFIVFVLFNLNCF